MKIQELNTVFICPDHDAKYRERKEHMVRLLTDIGIKQFSHYKSSTEKYPKCLISAMINVLNMNMNDEPILMLEDDVEFTGIKNIDIPSDCDALYLGISKSGGSKTINSHDGPSIFLPYNKTQVKVVNMLSHHAVLYVTKKYKKAVVEELEKYIDQVYHSDVVISRLHEKYNIYANRIPLFYQSRYYGNVIHVEDATKFAIKI